VIACGTENGVVQVWEVATSRLLYSFEDHAKPVRSITFDAETGLMCTGSDDQRIHLYDA
jgi:WD repeat-containing protein 61